MRTRTADFFKMDVPFAIGKAPSFDRHPLRRSLNSLHNMDALETNENMCAALWTLMERG